MIEINYLVVAACTALSMVVGFIWYGPLFGRQWSLLNGVNPDDEAAMKEMQKGMWIPMVVQIVSTFFLVWVLFIYLKAAADEMTELSNALWIYAGFVVPTLISTVIWTSASGKDQLKRFLIQAGYNLVMFVAFGYIITMWG